MARWNTEGDVIQANFDAANYILDGLQDIGSKEMFAADMIESLGDGRALYIYIDYQGDRDDRDLESIVEDVAVRKYNVTEVNADEDRDGRYVEIVLEDFETWFEERFAYGY